MQVFIKTLAAQTMVVYMEPWVTVEELEEQVSALTRVPRKFFRLMSQGRYLVTRSATLKESGVGPDANVSMMVRM